jgi:hypothetical protein
LLGEHLALFRSIRIAREKVALKSYAVRRDITTAADRAAIAEAVST